VAHEAPRNHSRAFRALRQSARESGPHRQALDEALCLGWIDGVRHSVHAASFSQRFSPRKPRSTWSTVNIKRFRELQAEGRVMPAGLRAFETGVKSQYSFESRPSLLSPAYRRTFRSHARAWTFFEALPPGYRRTCCFWVMGAKQPETQKWFLAVLIARSARGQGVPRRKKPLARSGRSGGDE
jgi:uncharacterized protein YdeI (YjbR/CyaY-like superfamily)